MTGKLMAAIEELLSLHEQVKAEGYIDCAWPPDHHSIGEQAETIDERFFDAIEQLRAIADAGF
jgi:hypothetical protein